MQRTDYVFGDLQEHRRDFTRPERARTYPRDPPSPTLSQSPVLSNLRDTVLTLMEPDWIRSGRVTMPWLETEDADIALEGRGDRRRRRLRGGNGEES